MVRQIRMGSTPPSFFHKKKTGGSEGRKTASGPARMCGLRICGRRMDVLDVLMDVLDVLMDILMDVLDVLMDILMDI